MAKRSTSSRAPARAPVGGVAQLGDALGDVRAALEGRLPDPPAPEPTTPPKVRLTPGQLMQLAFELVGREPQLVLDWDRIEVVEAVAVRETSPAAPRQSAPTPPTDVDTPHPAAQLRGRVWAGKDWRDDGLEHDPDSPLSEREVLARARKAGAIPRLRLRGLGESAARRQLDDFITLARHADLRVVRVVTGKGLGSRGEPVLRPMFMRWLARQQGRTVAGWRYEVDQDGAWGSALVVLRPGSRQRPVV